MKVKLDSYGIAPKKAHKEDAGFDLFTPDDICVPAGEERTVSIGVHVEIPYGYAGFIKTKSGINVNRSCTTEGVIDCGYAGEIKVLIRNHGPHPQYFDAGDKIAQLCLVKISEDSDVEIVKKIAAGERGNGGFGSTGK